MAKIDQYRQLVKEILTEYSSHKPAYGDIEVELILDTERDRYQLAARLIAHLKKEHNQTYQRWISEKQENRFYKLLMERHDCPLRDFQIKKHSASIGNI